MIWNTAILPADWTVETLTQKHGSRPHNPDIAATFFRAGEVEAWGQGIERIQTYCANYGSPAPEWRFDGAGIWTIFYNKTNPNTMEDAREKSREKSREKIIQLIREDAHITYEELAIALALSIKSIEKHIKLLKGQGVLRRIGGRKEGHWEVVE